MPFNNNDISATTPLLRLKGIRKEFPGVVAVADGSLDLYRGEIHALVGENGAGKSTLIKVLMGVHKADRGEIVLSGEKVHFDSPIDAHRAGITTIYQEFTLVGTLSVRANLLLGQEKTRKGIIDNNYESESARRIFEQLGIKIDPEKRVDQLTVAEQQMVEIGRALLFDARVLVMDEPTAALTPREVQTLFGILRGLTANGIGIIFISHRLEEIFDIADRVTVMRDGRTIETRPVKEINRKRLIELMVGRPIEDEFPRPEHKIGEVRLRVQNLSGEKLENLSFEVRGGEILGLAGLMGAGRTEAARLIFGADKSTGGEIVLDGKNVSVRSPRDAIRNGISLLTEDRKGQGLVLKLSARDNFSLANLKSWSRLGWIDQKQETARFYERVKNLNIKISSAEQKAEDLSGGNQQKLLVARWLETDSQVVIFDEPTRGIDVGAKYEMYLLINELAAMGKAIVVISSDLPEVLGISDRIIVMKEGKIAGEIIDVRKASQEDVMALAV
ncbi:fused D-ribose transporter subunits of ABC superfamily: ATP-binding components [Candidatus Zixiibacteriota bacterium]|nr:fused D-ribose transporter subunits of ABC superfamily: ATP-binding components [candidate division Zixibacteria bacterium]